MKSIFRTLWKRRGMLLSLPGSLLIIANVFFLPMFIITRGLGGYGRDEWPEWNLFLVFIDMYQADRLAPPQLMILVPLFLLPLLAVALILATSIMQFLRSLPRWMVIFNRVATIIGLILQILLVAITYIGIILSYSAAFGGGLFLTFIGFLIVIVGTFLT